MASAVLAPSLPPSASVDLNQRELEKQTKLSELRARLESEEAGRTAAKQLVQGGELANEGDITSDVFLSRWLRARNWDVARAYASLLKHAEWRVTHMPNGCVETASIANELACQKVYMQGCDRKGRPIMIIQVRKHNGWTRSLEELERLCCFLLDEACRAAAAHPESNPRGQCVALLDLTDMGALSMDIQAIKTLFALLGEHYVERLGAMFFWNPPYIFWGAWNTLSPLLPPPTLAKIKVLDPAAASELTDLVAPEVLPVEYGGAAPLAQPLGKQ